MKVLHFFKKIWLRYKGDMSKSQLFIHFSVLSIFLVLFIVYKFTMLITAIILLVLIVLGVLSNAMFVKQADGNGIIYGGRGKGKGLLLNKRINTDVNKYHFTNIPYNKYSKVINVKEYIDSIVPNTTEHFIENKVQIIPKIEKFEGVNVYWDDVGVYAPNFMDNVLKKMYPSLSALLPINRHTYNAYMIITTQDIERPYKILRELQTDFAIKALKTTGNSKSFVWNSFPILRHFIMTKYIYYENVKTAVDGKLPFNAKALINETVKHGYLTGGQATKEQFNAENGVVKYGRVIQLKRNVGYDTRYFHKVVYGKSVKEYYDKI